MSADVPAPPAAEPELRRAYPVFAVRDLAEALAYYRDALGFGVAWTWGDPPARAGVARGALEIQLVADGRFAPPGPSRVYCHVAGVDAYHRECRERGAAIVDDLGDRAFGMRDFRVVDPSGNGIGFGEPLAG